MGPSSFEGPCQKTPDVDCAYHQLEGLDVLTQCSNLDVSFGRGYSLTQ